MVIRRRRRPMVAVAVLAGLVSVAAPAPRAMAQAQPTKVAGVDLVRVYTEMQETKDTSVRFGNDFRSLQAQAQQKQADLENLKSTRDQLKPESSQWADANQKLMQAQMEARIWQELKTMELQRAQKQQSRVIFEHIDATVAEVAKQAGFDVVVNISRPEVGKMMEEPQVTLGQLQNAMAQRAVLYTDPKNDISNQVIAALDAKYKSAGGTAPAPAQPKK